MTRERTWTHRNRLEAALAFREADRVPIEIRIPEYVRADPRAARLAELADEHADCFGGIPGLDFGFCGTPAESMAEELDARDGRRRTRLVRRTARGDFTAVLERDVYNPGYQRWEKHFIETPEDLERLAHCDFPPVRIPDDYVRDLDAACGDERCPVIGLPHPFGELARMTPPEEFYAWLHLHPETVHALFAKRYRQLTDLVSALQAPFVHTFTALEMAIEPWLGRDMFDEFIFPYDAEVNAAVHRGGGLVRHHVHGPVFGHLEHWAEMGMDSIEPLEKPPAGDTDLAEAKRMMDGRMSLAGNLPSQFFIRMELSDIERQTKEAIEAGAPGGGFILRCASLVAGLNSAKTPEQTGRMITAVECFLETAVRCGRYG